MDIVILNRLVLTFMNKNPEFWPHDRFAVIRFFNPNNEYKLNFPEKCVAHMEVVCDDVTNTKITNAHDYIFFDESSAQDILDFVEKNKDKIDTLICACEAGISRSAGCGAALEKIYLNTDEIYSNTKYFPNSLIYKTLLSVYNTGL